MYPWGGLWKYLVNKEKLSKFQPTKDLKRPYSDRSLCTQILDSDSTILLFWNCFCLLIQFFFCCGLFFHWEIKGVWGSSVFPVLLKIHSSYY